MAARKKQPDGSPRMAAKKKQPDGSPPTKKHKEQTINQHNNKKEFQQMKRKIKAGEAGPMAEALFQGSIAETWLCFDPYKSTQNLLPLTPTHPPHYYSFFASDPRWPY